jgi:hypothetical protein
MRCMNACVSSASFKAAFPPFLPSTSCLHGLATPVVNLHTTGGRSLPKAKTNAKELAITPAEVHYQLWRDRRTMPHHMEEFAAITIKDEKRSHWNVRGPLDRRIEWDSEITEQSPGKRIRRQAMSQAEAPNDGELASWNFGPHLLPGH